MGVGEGISLFPWRGQAWSGQQSVTTTDHGERLVTKIVGGYVSLGGKELRTFPGWKCILNPADGGPGQDGFLKLLVDAQRPCAGPKGPNDALRERVPYSVVNGAYGAAANATVDVDETQWVYSELRHLHSFHRVREKLVLIGETAHRIEPILDSATRTVISYMSAWERAAGVAVIVLTPAPGAMVADSPNQIQVGDCLWIGTVTDANTADAARLSRRVHYVTAFDAGTGKITLATTVAAASTATNLSVRVGRSRGVQSGSGGLTPDGRAEYGESLANAIMDEDSLTAFYVEDPFDIDGAPVQKVYPSHVANRQRDYGDIAYTSGRGYTQQEGFQPSTGTWTGSEHFGVPRRRTMALPYRTVPAVSGDRVLLAAPGYGCLFQVPVIIPGTSDPVAFPRRGAVANYNDTNARPRSLGVPKAILAVPNASTTYQLVTGALSGFALGVYRIAVAYRDDATGEIGQLSEVWTADNTTGLAKPGTTAAGSTTTVIQSATALQAGAWVGFTLVIGAESQTITANTASTIEVGVAFTGAPGAGVAYAINGTHLSVAFMAMHPGYAMCETMALSVMVFMSKVGEEALNHVATVQCNENQSGIFAGGVYQNGYSTSSVYGLPFTEQSSGFCAEMFWTFYLPTSLATTPSLYNPSIEIPDQRTQPRGASWVRVVRGVRLSGGGIGDAGQKLELMTGIASMRYDGAGGNMDNKRELFMWRADNALTWYDQWHFVGNRCIPASYAGCYLWSRTLFPHPMEMVTLERVVNAHSNAITDATYAGTGYFRNWWRWQISENPHRWDQTRAVEHYSAYLVMPRGVVQIGEPGLPGVQSGFGVQVLDAQKDEDTVAGGEFRGVALMMTQRQTYATQWGQGPAGSVPQLVSSEFGCIAPNTVIEHDQAAFWLSDRGPCEFRGEVAWTGAAMERWFSSGANSRFVRDSMGMMRHAWAHYDESRGIVLLGVLENRDNLSVVHEGQSWTWATASDKVRSRFPCDTVFAYNTATGAWSEWHPPAGLEVLWCGYVTCADGLQRTAFLARDGRLYAFDDLFGQDNQEPLTVGVTAAGSSTTALGITVSLADGQTPGIDNTARGGLGAFVRPGMDVCIWNRTTRELSHRSTVASFDPLTATVTLASAGTWADSDYATIGGRSMTIETSYVSPRPTDPTTVAAVTVRARLGSRIQPGGTGAQRQPAWVRAWIMRAEHQSGRHGGGDDLRRESKLHANANGDLLGASDSEAVTRSARLTCANVPAKAFRLKLEVFGGAQVCLNDILLEVS